VVFGFGYLVTYTRTPN